MTDLPGDMGWTARRPSKPICLVNILQQPERVFPRELDLIHGKFQLVA